MDDLSVTRTNPVGPADSSPGPSFLAGQIVAGRFEIIQFLNRGGMGEVYAAMDLELREKVALKTIRPAIASSSAVIERFKQEVRQTRRITHPNVCRVYDLFTHERPSGEPAWFLTMELLEGRTLGQQLAAGGPMPMHRALPLIRGMVAALSAAHELGIVHRDFKPSNVMLVQPDTAAERAVVMDFGLALSADARTGDSAGTPAYVAPEQAAGAVAGPEADQFPLGLVIAEMLTGKPPLLDRKSAPNAERQLESWLSGQHRSVLNSHAREAIARCLAFRPQDRFRNLRDVIPTLDGSKRRGRVKRFTAAGVAAAAIAGIVALASGSDWGDRVTDPLRLTPETDWSNSPSITRDGKWVAYASNRAEAGNMDIWLDLTKGGAARRLTTDPAEDREPSISPDGKAVVFRSERAPGGMYIVGTDGSPARLLVPGGRSPAFSPDGRLIAYWTGDPDDSIPSGQLYVTSLSGGQPRRLVADFAVARYPAWSPDGQYLVFEGCQSNRQPFPACTEFWIVRADGGGVVNTGVLAALHAEDIDLSLEAGGWGATTHQKAWRGDRIVFGGRQSSIDALWEVPISGRSLRIAGKPRQLTSGQAREREPVFAANGAMAFAHLTGALHIWRIALDPGGGPGRATKLTDDPFQDCCPAASGDGRWLYFTRRTHNLRDLFRKDLATGAETVVLASDADKFWPVPTADGGMVAFEARRANQSFVELLVQGQPARTLCRGCSHPTSWFDGAKAIFHASPTGEMALLDVATGASRPVLPGRGSIAAREADWSPANECLLFSAVTNGSAKQVYAARFPRSAQTPQGPWVALTPASEGAERPRWSSDGKMFFYLSMRDGYQCVWGQRFVPGESAPAGEPFAIMHYHDYPRISPNRTTPRVRGLSTAGESIFLNVGEGTETIWTGVLRSPSPVSVFRDAILPKSSR
ncbi:MAG: protein kinase domain-containing protein [Bryobacteraceae bacterium]